MSLKTDRASGYPDGRKWIEAKSSKALLYVRVSTKDQADEGYSHESQIEKAEDYALRNGLRLVKPYFKVAESAWVNIKGISDPTTMNGSSRSVFSQLIDRAISDSEVGHIVFDVTDRIMRNDLDKPILLWLIKHHRVFVHLARTGKVLTPDLFPDDEFMLDIEAAAAKRYSNDISMKASAGMREKARQGVYPSAVPIGYINDGFGGVAAIDPKLSPFVRRAFELMATGNYSIDTLREQMTGEGMRTKKGHLIAKSSFAYMLRNPFYYGEYKWGGEIFKGKHAPLVSRVLWDRVQEVLSGRDHKRRQRKHLFHFNRLITCGVCGGMVLGELVKGKYTYYHCSFSKKLKHKGAYIRSEKLPGLFETFVQRVSFPDELQDWLLQVIHDRQGQTISNRAERLAIATQQRGKIKARLDRLLEMHLDGELDREQFQGQSARFNSQLESIESEIPSLQQLRDDSAKKAGKVLELCKRLYPLYLDLSEEKKVELLRLLGSNFVLDGETISGTYRKPFDYLADLADRTIKLPRLGSNQRPAD